MRYIQVVADDHFLLKAAVMFTRLTAIISSQPSPHMRFSSLLSQDCNGRGDRKTTHNPTSFYSSQHASKLSNPDRVHSQHKNSTEPHCSSQWGRLLKLHLLIPFHFIILFTYITMLYALNIRRSISRTTQVKDNTHHDR